MKVYGLVIQDEKALTNFDLNEYAWRLGIGNFRGFVYTGYAPQDTKDPRYQDLKTTEEFKNGEAVIQ